MIELPEALNLGKQLETALAGRTVRRALPPTRPHKFCWFNGNPADYDGRLAGSRFASAAGFGIFAELRFAGGEKLCVNDGVNLRLVPETSIPKDYQLALLLDGEDALVFTVAMYGGIVLHEGGYDNEYYQKSLHALSPFSPDFAAHYERTLAESKPSLSAKALLATEQRFPGIGNGVLQDILFDARIHPKRKLATLSASERDALYCSIVAVLGQMTAQGGRDTEKDLFGQPGGYLTKMSKNSMAAGCPVCGGPIMKEAYLGGSVYTCAHCQPL